MIGAQKAEIATVIHNFLPELHRKKPLPNHHLRTLHALQRCRTEAMGGRVEHCNQCSHEQIVYNSCRNRHCPKCGSLDREKWLINREADLLPVNYMHVVFTLPDKLNNLFLHHQIDCYNILFRIVNQVISGFAANPEFLDARIGYTAILHTWGQNLQYHPHLHLVVPAGGITRNNRWKPSKGDGTFLFPVDQLSSVFRAQMVEALREYVKTEAIKVDADLFNSLFNKEWWYHADRKDDSRPFSPAYKGPIPLSIMVTPSFILSNCCIPHCDHGKARPTLRKTKLMLSPVAPLCLSDRLKQMLHYILSFHFSTSKNASRR